jgi:hypothetical protein
MHPRNQNALLSETGRLFRLSSWHVDQDGVDLLEVFLWTFKNSKVESILATLQIARGGTARADLTVPFSIVAYLTASDPS